MVKNPFDREIQRHIVEAIVEAEKKTSGEIRVHVQPKCGQDAMKEAKKIFHRLRMQRTKERNGVLLFVSWKSRQFAILGDEGIHQKVGDDFWKQTRDQMVRHFSNDDVSGGIVAAVKSVGEKLKTHFPAQSTDKNELSNTMSEGT